MGIFDSFKKAGQVWDKSEKEFKDARKNDEVGKKRDQKNQGKKS